MKITVIAGALLCMADMPASREFPKNKFILPLRLQNDMVTNFPSSPEL